MNFGWIDAGVIMNTYVIPWTINIILAAAVFVFGRLVAGWIVRLMRNVLARSGIDAILANFFCSIASAALLLVVVILAIDQLGVDTTSLIALLGAAGIAIGLALKDSLGNFASGVMLIVFRPFVKGQYIEAAGAAGTVEAVNIFSTTLVTPDNRVIIVPNGAIYGGTIVNYSARPTRRVDMVFGISYGDDVAKAREIVHRRLTADDRVLADPAPMVVLAELGDSSVDLAVRPWTRDSDYWDFRFEFTEKVKSELEKNGITIPFPQMDVHFERAAAA
jgi:small conductance mechanosensitive channel